MKASLRIDCYCNLYTGLLSCKEEQHTGEKLNENKKCDGEEYESLPCGFIWRSFDPPLFQIVDGTPVIGIFTCDVF